MKQGKVQDIVYSKTYIPGMIERGRLQSRARPAVYPVQFTPQDRVHDDIYSRHCVPDMIERGRLQSRACPTMYPVGSIKQTATSTFYWRSVLVSVVSLYPISLIHTATLLPACCVPVVVAATASVSCAA